VSPVAPTRRRSPRTLVLGVAGLVVGLVLLITVFVFAIPSLTESGKVEVRLGSDTFDAGLAAKRADAVRRDGPILFSDVASGQRDIYLQHLGGDDRSGWLAFEARRAGTSRDCTLRWDPGGNEFVDPCDGTVVPADGVGLQQYEVTVTDDGEVVVRLNPDRSPATSSSTTSSLLITGTTPPR
jgi:hypothetical protein